MKKYFVVAFLVVMAQGAMAQSGTNSPYSQFGLGMLSDQSTGFNRGMNGLAQGFREHNQLNSLNPASYSSIDSLTFIFDVGISGQISNFKEGNRKLNANNSNFEYAVAGFRAFRHLGVSFGLLPYTNIGYSYSTTKAIGDSNNTSSYNSYNGSGGIHQAYLGMGWEPVRHFSIGFNASYLYGEMNRNVVNSYSSTSANTLTKSYSADIRSYKLDFGVQYQLFLSPKDNIVIGATYGLGHKIGGKPSANIISHNSQTNVSDTTSYPGKDLPALKLEIPTTIGIGLTYNRLQQIKVGFDYNLQKWSNVNAPVLSTDENGKTTYAMTAGQYKNRHKFTLGTEICPNENGRSFFNRMRYRAGVSYATPYYYIGSQNGPKEFSASLGFGIPIVNSYNNRSILNISGQWIHQDASGFVKDNTFRINIGLTFNERWFAKWKVE